MEPADLAGEELSIDLSKVSNLNKNETTRMPDEDNSVMILDNTQFH